MIEKDQILSELKKLGEKIDENTKQINQFYNVFGREILQLKFNLNILEREVRNNTKE